MRHDPYQRAQNELVATRLLPLFESDPKRWEALSYLNLDAADSACNIGEYLDHWYRNVRTDRRAVVAAIRDALLADTVPPLAASELGR